MLASIARMHDPRTDQETRRRPPPGRPDGRAAGQRRTSARSLVSRSDTVIPVGIAGENDGAEFGREAGGKYLDGKLRMLGLDSNAEVHRITGVNAGIISKLRRGKAKPESETITRIVDGLRPLAAERGVVLDGIELRVRFGLIAREDLEQAPVDPLYRDLHEVGLELAAVNPTAHETYRRQLEFILRAARTELADQPGMD